MTDARRQRSLVPLRRLALVAATVLLALVAGAAPASAEGDLIIAAKTTYTPHPDETRLEISIEYTLTNNKPNTRSGSVITRYYYDRYQLVVPDDAFDFSAVTSTGRTLDVSDEFLDVGDGTEARVASIGFPRVFHRGTVSFTFSFSLPGGEPRSGGGVRVNPAYTAFFVTAFGDPELSEVEIHIPDDFEVEVLGDFLDRDEEPELIVLSEDDIENPDEWGSFITARRDDALDSTSVEVGSLVVDVLAWPGDEVWSDRVVDVVTRGLPELQELVGLGFGDLEHLAFLEALDPSLGGYAGWYIVGEDRIEMGEELDDHVILHELAHLWFNEDLFIDRWINEGLADTFASRTVEAIGGESDEAYRTTYTPVTNLSIAVSLNDWDLPRSLADDDAERREEYGYNTSFFVVRTLYREIGAEGLSLVLNGAVDDLIAYQTAGTSPETVDPTDSWRRFLDLLQEVAGSDEAEELFRKYVVADRDLGRLDDRAEARAAFHAHIDSAGAWSTPFALRLPMSQWEFEDALAAVEAAGAVVGLRDELEALAASLGLDAPDSLEAAYEAASDTPGLHDAAALGDVQLEALEHVASARLAVDESRGFFTRIGLIGQNPDREWSEAAEMFEAEDLEGTHSAAEETLDLLADAERVGRKRVLVAGAGLGGFLLVSSGGTWLLVRGRRRRRNESDRPGEATGSYLLSDDALVQAETDEAGDDSSPA